MFLLVIQIIGHYPLQQDPDINHLHHFHIQYQYFGQYQKEIDISRIGHVHDKIQGCSPEGHSCRRDGDY